MKILLIGPGSIGKRHLNNLFHLGYHNINVVSRRGRLPDPFSDLTTFLTLEDALKSEVYDAAILCTPTAFHIPAIIHLLKKQIAAIYIEKPVSNSLHHLQTINELSKSYPNKIIVGYDLHFDPGLQRVKQLIVEGTIGKVVSVNAQVGQYLPDWRPHEDYTQGMSAKKETGGGVLLDLVHEFDYVRWLCGPAKTIASINNNSSTLQIETEDVAEVLLQFENGAIGTIHLDYLQPKLVRNCLITGQSGTICWNLSESIVKWVDREKNEQFFDYKGYERNQRFIEIMKAFMDRKDDRRLTSLEEGIESLKMVLAAKQSSETRQFVSPATLIENMPAI